MKNAKELKMIECSGSPCEIGPQWGKGCRESILRIAEKISQSVAMFYQVAKGDAVANGQDSLAPVQYE